MAKNNQIDDWTEIKDDGPDDWQDLSAPSESNQMDVVSDLLRAAAQSATFNFADELAAGGESLLTDKPYEKALAESRANFEAARKRSPKASFAGDIVGAVVPAAATALTGGLAAPAALATTGGRIAAGALAGAGASALQDVGTSQKQGMEALSDVNPVDALQSGALGAIIPGLGAALKGGSSAAKNILSGKVGSEVKEAFKYGKAGEELGTEAISLAENKKIQDTAEKALDKVYGKAEELKGSYETLKKQMPDIKDVGQFKEASTQFLSKVDNLDKAEQSALGDLIEDVKNKFVRSSDLNNEDLVVTLNKLRNVRNKEQIVKGSRADKLLTELEDQIKTKVSPDYFGASSLLGKEYAGTAEALQRVGLNTSLESLPSKQSLKETRAFEKLSSAIKGAGDDVSNQRLALENTADIFEKSSPEAANLLRKEGTQAVEKLKLNQEVSKELFGPRRVANLAGRAVKSASDATPGIIKSSATGAANVSRVVKDAVDVNSYLTKVANAARASGKSGLANQAEYIAQQPVARQSQLIFILNQNPELRKLFKEEE